MVARVWCLSQGLFWGLVIWSDLSCVDSKTNPFAGVTASCVFSAGIVSSKPDHSKVRTALSPLEQFAMYNPIGHASLVIATSREELPTRSLRIKRLGYERSRLPEASPAKYSIPGPDSATKVTGKLAEIPKYRCDFKD